MILEKTAGKTLIIITHEPRLMTSELELKDIGKLKKAGK